MRENGMIASGKMGGFYGMIERRNMGRCLWEDAYGMIATEGIYGREDAIEGKGL